MSPPALLVADDHPLFRAAVVQVIRGRFGAFEVLEASSASSLSAALAAHPGIELVLLDLTMPGTHGFSALLHVRGAYPQLPVVVISSNDHPRIIRRAQQFGASGFISKAAAAEAITQAIEAVLEGDTVFPSMAAELSQEDAELAARLAQLTPHQFKTLLYLADGLLNKQIAQEMGVTEHTVKVHVTAILKKLGCHSRTQVAVLVRNLEADGGLATGDSALA
ncbi:DNA-binding NarL/FixJ family response regulator [Comamonas sp. BIGb0152]|uniref:response regulator n=1 Tax=Comamonas sp. BIGb0152 TaxID=2940601 RepID=UPI002169432D|nr:response regulator transcription factor [Comamonas sp. BIGb0152]MCS4294844.1 DNA-binding NarL/FixJ family response regulator [Comamonas sp. BIGb0152]